MQVLLTLIISIPPLITGKYFLGIFSTNLIVVFAVIFISVRIRTVTIPLLYSNTIGLLEYFVVKEILSYCSNFKEELGSKIIYNFINIPCIIPKAVPPSSSNLAQICKFILSLSPL